MANITTDAEIAAIMAAADAANDLALYEAEAAALDRLVAQGA